MRSGPPFAAAPPAPARGRPLELATGGRCADLYTTLDAGEGEPFSGNGKNQPVLTLEPAPPPTASAAPLRRARRSPGGGRRRGAPQTGAPQTGDQSPRRAGAGPAEDPATKAGAAGPGPRTDPWRAPA